MSKHIPSQECLCDGPADWNRTTYYRGAVKDIFDTVASCTIGTACPEPQILPKPPLSYLAVLQSPESLYEFVQVLTKKSLVRYITPPPFGPRTNSDEDKMRFSRSGISYIPTVRTVDD